MKLLYTMLRIRDLEKSLHFYTEVLGMKLLRKHDYPEGKFTLAFVGFADEKAQAVIELTYNWDTNDYEMGNAFGHIAIGVDDVYEFCDHAKALGAKITREPGPMKHGSTVIAFIEDPDGYKIEVLKQKR